MPSHSNNTIQFDIEVRYWVILRRVLVVQVNIYFPVKWVYWWLRDNESLNKQPHRRVILIKWKKHSIYILPLETTTTWYRINQVNLNSLECILVLYIWAKIEELDTLLVFIYEQTFIFCIISWNTSWIYNKAKDIFVNA